MLKNALTDLFELVKDSLTLMDAWLMLPYLIVKQHLLSILEDIVMLRQRPQKWYMLSTIHPNGISSSMMIKENLLALFLKLSL